MYDIHCHILSGVDDGSGSMTDSLEMAKLAADSGIKAIVATPHCNMPDVFGNYWSYEFDRRVSELNEALSLKRIPLEVYTGQEIFAHGDIVQKLRSNELVTLNFSRYILVEFDFNSHEKYILETVQKTVAAGYVPIVAHPERYALYSDMPEAVRQLRRTGALVQLNSGSIKGSFGYYPAQTADYLLSNQLADFVASDAHSQYSRTPDLSHAHESVCENYSYEYADLLFDKNPLNVINNKEIR